MVSQCVTNGTEVRLNCSLEDLEDYVYFTWDFSEPNWEFSDDTWSDIDDIIQEISCNFMIDDVNFYYHSVLVAGKQNAIMSVAFVYALVDF